MHNFRAFFSEITEICGFWWPQGGSFLFIRECVFGETIYSQFQSKVIRMYTIFGVARAPLPENILFLVS